MKRRTALGLLAGGAVAPLAWRPLSGQPPSPPLGAGTYVPPEIRDYVKFLYPVERPPRSTPAAAESRFFVDAGRRKQLIEGLGFEIQSDSIRSGNQGMDDSAVGVSPAPSTRSRAMSVV